MEFSPCGTGIESRKAGLEVIASQWNGDFVLSCLSLFGLSGLFGLFG